MAVDFNYFLNQKYMQLQQQADATSQNAKTNALTGAAAARLDNTRANLLPKESREGLLKSASERGLIDQQAAVVAPESAARIGQIKAETGLTQEQTVGVRRGNTSIGELAGSSAINVLQSILGGGSSSPVFRTSEITPSAVRRRGGQITAEELDRMNGF